MTYTIQIAEGTFLDTKTIKRVTVGGIEFDETFLSNLVIKHLKDFQAKDRRTFSDAFDIYMRENPSANRRKFRNNANQYFTEFTTQIGDLYLDELSHGHITKYRDYLLGRGLHPNSVRKHINILNAIVNMAFKHLDISKLSPFRGLQIQGEGESPRVSWRPIGLS